MKTGEQLMTEAKTRIKEVTPQQVLDRQRSGEAITFLDAHVIVYCANGNRSVFAADLLQQMGYEDVASMAGGIRGWSDAGGEVE